MRGYGLGVSGWGSRLVFMEFRVEGLVSMSLGLRGEG